MTRKNGLLTLALTFAVALVPAAPALAANDGDRLPQKWEKRHKLNLKRDDSRRDLDKDGLSNYGEYRAHTNPRKRDTDRDGRRDGREDFDRDHLRNAVEIKMGYDPGDADSDDDGVKDGKEHAGQITQLDDSSITITLAAGGSITALLSDDLQVKCKSIEEDQDKDEDEDEGDHEDDGDAVGSDHDEADDELVEDEHGEEGGDGPKAEKATDDDDEHQSEEAPNDEQNSCRAKHLKVGAIVHKAKIELTGDGAVLVAIKLVAKDE
ncbi:MAG TPA: hypothetical protein VES79_12680 [Solirubrobacteraceae bacterium]|nr:hypothetical protein [Solirubrobacteraceae bacterium]